MNIRTTKTKQRRKEGRKEGIMGRFISLMIFLVEYLLVVHINLSMAHASEEATPNVQQQLNIFNRRIGFELEQVGILPIIADAPAGSTTPEPSETTAAEGPDIRRMGKDQHRHHHSSDKSEAGGGLIIGGLATAIFAAVFCYIRVTRKTSTDHMIHMGSSSSTMAVSGSTRTDETVSAASSSSSTK